MTIEQRARQYLVPVSLRLSVQQQVDAVVALAIERREEEDERAEDKTANNQLHVRLVLETGKHIFAGVHRTDEV